MGKYAKTFETENQYSAFTQSTDYILPNVSYVTQTQNVYYNPIEEPIVVVKYNVTSTEYPAILFNSNEIDNVSKMVIDGVEQPSVVNEYEFNTTGEHVVQYFLASTSIGDNMFSYCEECELVSADISNSITYVGDYAFQMCASLTSITIPNSVTYLGDNAFSDCTSLQFAVIGGGVTGGCDYLFSYCTSLTSITINSNITNKHLLDSYENPLTTLVIGGNATYVGAAFCGCPNLTSVTLGNSIITIGESAFENCTGLTSINIPNSVTTIGNSAFSETLSVSSLTLGDSVTTIGDYAFYNKGYSAGYASLILPNTLTTVGKNAFYSASIDGNLVIPDSVISIDDYAFDSNNFTSVTIGSGVVTWGSASTFSTWALCEAVINSRTTGPYMFYYCENLSSITFGPNVREIGEHSFMWCELSETFTIPDTITTIHDFAFMYAFGVEHFIIGSGVTSIGENLFGPYDNNVSAITSYATTAPAIVTSASDERNWTFEGIEDNGILRVPSGSTGYDVWMDSSNLGGKGWTLVEF